MYTLHLPAIKGASERPTTDLFVQWRCWTPRVRYALLSGMGVDDHLPSSECELQMPESGEDAAATLSSAKLQRRLKEWRCREAGSQTEGPNLAELERRERELSEALERVQQERQELLAQASAAATAGDYDGVLGTSRAEAGAQAEPETRDVGVGGDDGRGGRGGGPLRSVGAQASVARAEAGAQAVPARAEAEAQTTAKDKLVHVLSHAAGKKLTFFDSSGRMMEMKLQENAGKLRNQDIITVANNAGKKQDKTMAGNAVVDSSVPVDLWLKSMDLERTAKQRSASPYGGAPSIPSRGSSPSPFAASTERSPQLASKLKAAMSKIAKVPAPAASSGGAVGAVAAAATVAAATTDASSKLRAAASALAAKKPSKPATQSASSRAEAALKAVMAGAKKRDTSTLR